MVIECAQTQESLCYDGTTTAVVLAGELLSNSEGLMNKGLHPNIVCKGYTEAANMAIDRLSSLKVTTHPSTEDEFLIQVAKTAMTGKTLDAAIDDVASLCVQAVKKAGNAEKVRVLSLPGGGLRDSYLFNGAIVNKDLTIEREIDGEHNIILLNSGLEPQKTDENIQVQLDMQGYTQLLYRRDDV